ncbi:hypothetical protein BKA63DRAFT_572219 [Paraphoma chrysanthemicola]|nr:hypothetical protein BKA63DRAFT_572219 [Paraphoma chrysanthemicola]
MGSQMPNTDSKLAVGSSDAIGTQSPDPLAERSSLDVFSNEILFMIFHVIHNEVQFNFDNDPAPSDPAYFRWANPIHGLVDSTSRQPTLHTSRRLSQSSISAIANLSRTCKRYKALVQPLLFRSPVLSIGPTHRLDEKSSLHLLVRTLFEQPELRKYISMLRIDIAHEGMSPISMPAFVPEPVALSYRVASYIDSVTWLSRGAKPGWKWQLQKLRPLPFCALAISLLPNLRELCLPAQARGKPIFADLFWVTKFLGDATFDINVRMLAQCPGLANLTHVKVCSLETVMQDPFMQIETLNSLDISLNHSSMDVPVAECALARITVLRLDCNLGIAQSPWRRSLNRACSSLASILPAFTNLSTLELYDNSNNCDYEESTSHCTNFRTLERYATLNSIWYEKPILVDDIFRSLVQSLTSPQSTLRKLELPRGSWIPHDLFTSTLPPDVTSPNDSEIEHQHSANTGPITDFSGFETLEELIIHSTAIISKGMGDTQVADPESTLPRSVRKFTVYGAHDGLWGWISAILELRGSYFTCLKSITLWKEGAVPGLELSTVAELKGSREVLWQTIWDSRVKLKGDV